VFSLTNFVLAQLTITSAQLMVHATNDAWDLAADRANRHRTRWSGGSGALLDGGVSVRGAVWAGIAAAVVAVGGAALLAGRVPSPRGFVALFGVALATAWTYSSPPVRLVGKGLGELAGALLLAGLTPAIGYLAQGGSDLPWLFAVLAPLVAVQCSMLIAVSLPDREGDAAVGKRTLAVRLGADRAGRLAALMIAISGVLVAALAAAGFARGAVAGYLVWVPLGAWHARALLTGAASDPARWERLGIWAIALVMGAAATLAIGLVTWIGPGGA
jgi:1,4-dihydroxy-2-naphthoate octaprenyltransferase